MRQIETYFFGFIVLPLNVRCIHGMAKVGGVDHGIFGWGSCAMIRNGDGVLRMTRLVLFNLK